MAPAGVLEAAPAGALPVVCECGRACDPGECLSMSFFTGPVVPSARDAWDRPDEVAEWVRAHGPDDALLEPLLAAARSGGLSVRGRVDALTALESARAMLDAVQLRLIADMGASDPDGKDWAREDVAAALRVSPMTAANRLELARAAVARFPLAMKALDAGSITVMHVRRLVEGCARLDEVEAGWIEQLVLPQAGSQTVGQFGKAVDQFAMMLDDASSEKRHELARKDRRVVVRALADGMAELTAYAPLDQVAMAKVVIDGLAGRIHPGDPRTADQRRADVFCDLLAGSIHPDTIHAALASAGDVDTDAPRPDARAVAHEHGVNGRPRTEFVDLPRRRGMRPTVSVTVPLSTLAGAGDTPGHLDGFGPIPAWLARRIAGDPSGTWRRFVTDDRGRLVDCGRTTYRPPADLARHVVARDRTCCFPGCSRAAARCEIDHCRDWADGGGTSAENLYALCARHHHLKHEAGWSYEPLPDGDLLWTSPSGHTYRRPHATYPDASFVDPPPPRAPRAERPPLPDDPPPF